MTIQNRFRLVDGGTRPAPSGWLETQLRPSAGVFTFKTYQWAETDYDANPRGILDPVVACHVRVDQGPFPRKK
jgi:hypothetical protein